jgi:dolichol kinase
MKLIFIIWILFIIIFSGLAIFSFILASKKIDKFEAPKRPMSNAIVKIKGVDIDEPLNIFVSKFNQYINNYNKSNSSQNRIAGFGYIVAVLVSIASLLIELKVI